MTEVVVVAASQQECPSSPTGLLTHSAMAARTDEPSAAATKRHGSETSSESPLSSAVSSASSSSSCGPPPPPPTESTQELPRRSITRKRAASINTEEANRPLVESLSLNTPSTASPRPFDGSRERICLCTPAPKVPRPRNAFILYRQHHQAQVVQQHPGLANPEISKIIGEQWRAEPEEAKNQWKLLAEEEKQRHQRQHPDYRYQPRRGNKAGSAHSTQPTPAAPGEDPHRCSKCGGRYIATPRTPSTPFMTPTVSRMASTPYGHPPPPLGHHTRGSKGDMSRNGRFHPAPQWSSTQNALNLYDIHENYEPAMSPNEAKRRRYNTTASYHNFHALSSPPSPFPQPDHHHQAPHSSYPRRPSLSNPTTPAAITYPAPPLLDPSAMVLSRSGPGPMMPPPPRPSHVVPVSGTVPTKTSASTAAHYDTNPTATRLRTPSTNKNINAKNYHQHYPGDSGGGFDESLRLPPLQTQQLSATSPDDNNNNNELAASTASASASATAATGLGIVHPTRTISSYGAATITGEGGEVVVKKERERERDAAAAAERAPPARSVETMVMSISFVSKLRVLERISPPLGAGAGAGSSVVAPGNGFSSGNNRGPVIAVEGPNASLVRAVSRVVERALRAASPAAADEKGGGWEVKCWEDENSNTFTSPCGSVAGGREDVAMGDDGLSNAVSRHGSRPTSVIDGPSADVNPFTAYLRTIADWHAKSAEIVQFVTSPSTSMSISTPTSTPTRQTRLPFMSSAGSVADSNNNNNDNNNNNGRIESEEPFESTPRMSHHRRGPLLPGDSAADTPTASTATTTSISRPTNTNTKTNNKLPIALLPSGFALTLSDRFASVVPISDAYAPVDHWQWMATLWRGIVGADLVIYVVAGGTNNNTMVAAAEDGHPGSGGGGIGPVNGTVEVRSGGLIIVRVLSPPAGGSDGGSSSRHGNAEAEGMVDEKMERRLGFEVVEWVRSGGWVNAGQGGDGYFGMEY